MFGRSKRRETSSRRARWRQGLKRRHRVLDGAIKLLRCNAMAGGCPSGSKEPYLPRSAASTDADDLVIRLCDTGLVDDDAVGNPVGISRPAVFQGKGDGPAIVG